MKNLLRFFGLLYISAIFGCGIAVATTSFEKENVHKHSNQEPEQLTSSFSKSSSAFINSFEYSNRVVSAFRVKSPFFLGVSIDQVSEVVLYPKLNQYSFLSKNFLVRHRKNDIIFPFHYHW